MELPLEIITGVQERQRAVEAAGKEVEAAANESCEADKAYYQAEYPPGIRGGLCRIIESNLKIWPAFIGRGRKELRAEKEKKISVWLQKTAEKKRREIDLDDFIGRYLASVSPEFKGLLEQFSAADKLFESVDSFENQFFESADILNEPVSEKSKSALKQQLVRLSSDFATVQTAVRLYLPVLGESNPDLNEKIAKAYKVLTDALEKGKNPERIPRAYEDFANLSSPIIDFSKIVWDHRESLDEKIRPQVDYVKGNVLKES